jgi:DNA-binding winged helix-turn-helix (wHTH) protein
MGIPQPSRFVHFGPFQLDLRAAELRRNGAKVRLPDQSIKVLTLLVESSGEVVTREVLHRELWPNGTTRLPQIALKSGRTYLNSAG